MLNYQYPKPIFSTVSGAIPNIISSLRRTLGQYSRTYYHLKVGLTNDPSIRWVAHKANGWEAMFVIYHTSSRNNASRAERLLVNHLRNNHDEQSLLHNTRKGGGGNYSGSDNHYVYLLASSRWRKRERCPGTCYGCS